MAGENSVGVYPFSHGSKSRKPLPAHPNVLITLHQWAKQSLGKSLETSTWSLATMLRRVVSGGGAATRVKVRMTFDIRMTVRDAAATSVFYENAMPPCLRLRCECVCYCSRFHARIEFNRVHPTLLEYQLVVSNSLAS